ncbi:O-Antigen ligase [compost metagenome]
MTFTGRTLIWAALIDTILSNNYWLGFGYEAFWGATNGSLKVNWGMWDFIPPHAHNGFLQTWTSLGLIGLVTLNIALLQFGAKATKSLYSSKDPVRRANLLFLPLVIIVNITEFSFLSYGNIIWIIFIYLAFLRQPVSNKTR